MRLARQVHLHDVFFGGARGGEPLLAKMVVGCSVFLLRVVCCSPSGPSCLVASSAHCVIKRQPHDRKAISQLKGHNFAEGRKEQPRRTENGAEKHSTNQQSQSQDGKAIQTHALNVRCLAVPHFLVNLVFSSQRWRLQGKGLPLARQHQALRAPHYAALGRPVLRPELVENASSGFVLAVVSASARFDYEGHTSTE
jgi:hypothetical protein